jgi:hypothetical protein
VGPCAGLSASLPLPPLLQLSKTDPGPAAARSRWDQIQVMAL